MRRDFGHIFECTVQQIGAIRKVQVFRHALAVGHVMQAQLVAHDDVERRRKARSFVDLAQDAANHVGPGISTHHVIEGVAAAGRGQQQQTFDRAAVKHCHLLGDHLVALAHAHGVDQDHVLVLQIKQGLAQFTGILHEMHRNTEDAPVNTQLFVSADPVAVGGDQRHLAGAVAQHATRRELGRGGGLADTSRADQSVNTTAVDDVALCIECLQAALGRRFNPAQSAFLVEIKR